MITFTLVFKINGSLNEAIGRDFFDRSAAEAYAGKTLRLKVRTHRADRGTVFVGEVFGTNYGDVRWLGSYNWRRGGEVVWMETMHDPDQTLVRIAEVVARARPGKQEMTAESAVEEVLGILEEAGVPFPLSPEEAATIRATGRRFS